MIYADMITTHVQKHNAYDVIKNQQKNTSI